MLHLKKFLSHSHDGSFASFEKILWKFQTLHDRNESLELIVESKSEMEIEPRIRDNTAMLIHELSGYLQCLRKQGKTLVTLTVDDAK